jgi:PAS domain S-box-containing protein
MFPADGRTDEFATTTHPTVAPLLSLLNRIPALVWTTDLECRFTFLTGAGLRTLAVDASHHSGRRIDSLFSAGAFSDQTKESDAVRSHRKAIAGTAGSFDAEVNGRNLEAHVEALRAPNGEVKGAIGLALDSTERMVAENALRISERSYRSLIEEAPYGICRATESGQLLQVNRAMLELLGYSPRSEADLLLRDLPLIFDSPDGFDAFRRELLQKNTVQGLECAWLRRDGQEIRVQVGGRAIRDLDGKILYLDILAENVTDRKELEARLEQAQRLQAVGQLAGGIAHDFNNLLTVINGYCDLLLLSNKQDGEPRQSLTMIRQAGGRAASLTRQLLTFSRKQVSRQQPVQLNTSVAEVVELTSRLIGENIVLTQTLDSMAERVLADSAQINQMLMNLVINARDAMAGGGELNIATSRQHIGAELTARLGVPAGDYIVLTVADTGVGMDDHVRAHLFEPFFTTKPVGEGTGLGLATVYQIVKHCRGAITVDSQPGAGTTFRIYLPKLREEKKPADTVRPPQTLVRGASTILVVEDEPAVRHFVTDVLKGSGYSVLEACNAEEALALSSKHSGPIDLLLTDMVMPGLDGRQLAIRMKTIHPEARALLVSGFSRSLAAGDAPGPDVHFLPKPFSPSQLTHAVSQILSVGAALSGAPHGAENRPSQNHAAGR